MRRVHAALALLGALTIAQSACGGGGGDPPAGGSGATCPPGGTTLRYAGGGDGGAEPADFGASFFATWCTSCHGNPPTGGAPSHSDFTGLAEIREHAALIDRMAAAGPAATGTTMPPLGAPNGAPGVAERTWLGTWLACGAP